MVIIVNNVEKNIKKGAVAQDIFGPDSVVIIDGYQVPSDYIFSGGESVIAIQKGVMPPPELLESMMAARHSVGVHAAVKNASVCVAGLGGIGSNLAVALARLGVGKLRIIDYDIVEPSNLNRQSYYSSDLGEYKAIALERQLRSINPYVTIESVIARIETENIEELICGSDIVCEAFDNPQCKAMLVNAALGSGVEIVACSGMAGYGSANEIITRQPMANLTLIGDGVSEAKIGDGLMSPRVMVVAGHMANAVLNILINAAK